MRLTPKLCKQFLDSIGYVETTFSAIDPEEPIEDQIATDTEYHPLSIDEGVQITHKLNEHLTAIHVAGDMLTRDDISVIQALTDALDQFSADAEDELEDQEEERAEAKGA